MFCTNCGRQLSEGADFCLNCGTPVEVLEIKRYCPECKKMFDDQEVYCDCCGTLLKQYGQFGI